MPIYTIGAVPNLEPTGTVISQFVELRITNTTVARLEPIVVNAYSVADSGPEGIAEIRERHLAIRSSPGCSRLHSV